MIGALSSFFRDDDQNLSLELPNLSCYDSLFNEVISNLSVYTFIEQFDYHYFYADWLLCLYTLQYNYIDPLGSGKSDDSLNFLFILDIKIMVFDPETFFPMEFASLHLILLNLRTKFFE